MILMLHSKTVPVNTLFMTRDALTSQDSTVFVPALRNLFDAPLGYMASVPLLVSGVVALYCYTKGEPAYKKQVKSNGGVLKWLDLGISSAIIIEIVALLAGISDPAVVKICAGSIVVTCALGWLSEKQNQTTTKNPDWSAYGISLISGMLPWLIIGETLLFTSLYGSVRLPWFSYALAGSMLVGFVLLALNQLLNIHAYKNWKHYMFVERNYLTIDIITKLAFAGILIIGLKG